MLEYMYEKLKGEGNGKGEGKGKSLAVEKVNLATKITAEIDTCENKKKSMWRARRS